MIYELVFWVSGGMLWQRLKSFLCWWWWVLSLWDLEMWRGWEVEVVLVVRLLERRLLPLLLLAENLDVVLELRKSCPFSVDMLSSSFGTLGCCLPPCDGFLFSTESLDLLLDPGQLLFFCNFIFVGLIFPIFHLDLFKLCIFLDDLYQQRRSQG
jgi:hypothetical protein